MTPSQNFSPEEMVRYSRHFSLPNVGLAGQKKLKAAKVLCVGAGGLGSPLTLYLAAAGVGTIGIIDPDQVEASNLQRQILYSQDMLNMPKVEAAKARLQGLNPHIQIHTYPEPLSEVNALTVIKNYDIVVDGTDNFSTRFLVNDACFELQKPNIYASVFQFEGQISVFTAKDGPCYRCLYPQAPPMGLVPNCAEGGIFGVLPGIMGALQANEVIKLILGIGEPLIGRLLCFDALSLQFKEFSIAKSKTCALCAQHKKFNEVTRPHFVCATNTEESEISVQELAELIRSQADFFLLDVREPFEYEICHLNGKLIPLKELPEQLNELPRNKPIIVHCKLGGRSSKAAELLKAQGFSAKSLRGGIMQWIADIDPTLSKY